MPKYFPLIFLFAAALYCAGCFPKKNVAHDPEKNKAELMKADEDFSALSEAKGMKTAFLEYIDSNGILLRPNTLPIAGADAIDFLIATNDSGYTMTWQPKSAVVALSGELGFTYGLYEIKPSVKDTLLYGTYVNIWKKQQDGKWKFVLESGHEGIGEE